MTPPKIGYIYLIQVVDDLGSQVYKVGKTVQEHSTKIRRWTQYPPGSVPLFNLSVSPYDQCDQLEKDVIERLRLVFGDPVRGREYFEGNYQDIVTEICDVWRDYMRSIVLTSPMNDDITYESTKNIVTSSPIKKLYPCIDCKLLYDSKDKLTQHYSDRLHNSYITTDVIDIWRNKDKLTDISCVTDFERDVNLVQTNYYRSSVKSLEYSHSDYINLFKNPDNIEDTSNTRKYIDLYTKDRKNILNHAHKEYMKQYKRHQSDIKKEKDRQDKKLEKEEEKREKEKEKRKSFGYV